MNFQVRNNEDLKNLTNMNLYVQDSNNQYIHIAQMQNYFGYGRNSFLVGIRQGCFAKNSTLQIYFIDSKWNTIPVVVTEFKQKGMIRCYVQVNESASVGFGTLVIVGKLQNLYDKSPIPLKWLPNHNVKLQKKIYVNPFQMTPSVLRLTNKPEIQLSFNDKRLYEYDGHKYTQRISISAVTAVPIDYRYVENGITKSLNNDFIVLDIDTQSIKNTIFHEKFINYKLTNNIDDVTTFGNYIFSGSHTDNIWSKGSYSGSISSKDKITLSHFNGVITSASVMLGNSKNTIQRLIGYNIDSFQMSIPPTPSRFETSKQQYILYVQSGNEESINQIYFPNTSQKITPISFISHIQSATNINLQTTYFSGSISSSAPIYSQQFILYTGSQVLGHKTNLQIKDKSKWLAQTISSSEYYNSPYEFSSSLDTYSLVSTKNTIFKGSNIYDSYFRNEQTSNLISFSQITGQLFSKQLIMKYDDSYFSGSIVGKGSFNCKQEGSILISSTSSSTCSVGQYVQLSSENSFVGSGYGANIQFNYFSGSIISSSILHKNIIDNQTRSNLSYQKFKIQGSEFSVNIQNINIIQLSVPNRILTPQILTFNVDYENSGSLYIKSNDDIVCDRYNDGKIILNGMFNLGEIQQQSELTFNGIFQIGQTIDEIEKYYLQRCQLTPSYGRIFNTSQVVFFGGEYDKIFIPVAIDKKQLNYQKLFNRLYDTKSIPGNYIQLDFQYKNQFDMGKYVGNANSLPLNIKIDNVQVVSGQFNGLQLYYYDNNNSKNQQFLSKVSIPKNSSFPLYLEIQIPSLSFIGQNITLKAIPLDGLGNRSPQQYYSQIHNVKLNNSQLGPQTYIENNLNRLSATDVFYNDSYPNVGMALDYLMTTGGGSGGVTTADNVLYGDSNVQEALDYLYNIPVQVGNIINIILDSFQYTIGDTQSVNISWTVNPLVTIDSYEYRIFESDYLGNGQYNPVTDVITLNSDVTSHTLDIVFKPTMFQITSTATSGQVQTKEVYIHFYNVMSYGALDRGNGSIDYSGLHWQIRTDYNGTFQIEAVTDQSIVFLIPKRMVWVYPDLYTDPQFTVGMISGGFRRNPTLINYTNGQGYVQQYVEYYSINTNLGRTFVRVDHPI